MSKRNPLICLLLLAPCLQPVGLRAEPTNAPPTAVIVGFDRGRATYQVDAKPVRSEDMLDVLRQVKERRGREGPVVVLIDERNSFVVLSNIRGIIDKGGFSSVRYFCFTADRRMMEELLTNQRPAVPFSLNPVPQPHR